MRRVLLCFVLTGFAFDGSEASPVDQLSPGIGSGQNFQRYSDSTMNMELDQAGKSLPGPRSGLIAEVTAPSAGSSIGLSIQNIAMFEICQWLNNSVSKGKDNGPACTAWAKAVNDCTFTPLCLLVTQRTAPVKMTKEEVSAEMLRLMQCVGAARNPSFGDLYKACVEELTNEMTTPLVPKLGEVLPEGGAWYDPAYACYMITSKYSIKICPGIRGCYRRCTWPFTYQADCKAFYEDCVTRTINLRGGVKSPW